MIKDMKYFTYNELIRSDVAKSLKINNTPNDLQKQHLRELIEKGLDIIREKYEKPIYVSSGYRCDRLNKEVGGSPTSSHKTGYAADIYSKDDTFEDFSEFLIDLLRNGDIPFDECIEEHSKGSKWMHFSIKNAKGLQRRKMLLYKNNKYEKI